MKEINEDDAVERMLDQLEGLLKQQYNAPAAGAGHRFDPDATEELDVQVAPAYEPPPSPRPTARPSQANSPTRLSDIARNGLREPYSRVAAVPESPAHAKAMPSAASDVSTGEYAPVDVDLVADDEAAAQGPGAAVSGESPAPASKRGDGGHMTRRLTTRLGQLLLDADLVSEARLRDALARQRQSGERLGTLLINDGFIDEHKLLAVLADQYGVPAAKLDELALDNSLATLVPRDMAERYLLVPMSSHDDSIDIAMVDPTDFVAMAHVRFATALRPNAFITTVNATQRAIARIYDQREATDETTAAITPRDAVKQMIRERDALLMAADQDPRKFYQLAATIDEFVDEILRTASGDGFEGDAPEA